MGMEGADADVHVNLPSTTCTVAAAAQKRATTPLGKRALAFAMRSRASQRCKAQKRSDKGERSPERRTTKKRKKKAPNKKPEGIGKITSQGVQAEPTAPPPTIAQLKEVARKQGLTSKASSSQEEVPRGKRVSLSNSQEETSCTYTLRQEQQEDPKMSSRSRSATSTQSCSRRIHSCRQKSPRGKSTESGSSNPSQERRYLPSIARGEDRRSAQKRRRSRSRHSSSKSLAKRKQGRKDLKRRKERKQSRKERTRRHKEQKPATRRAHQSLRGQIEASGRTSWTDLRDQPAGK